MEKMKLGVLISGRGSNLQALIDACKDDGYPAEIALVMSNVAGAGGLERAETAGIATAVVDHKGFPTRELFEDALHKKLSEAGVELICLAGFMRVLTPRFIERWPDKVVNIHPSLLPAFTGIHVHEQVVAKGVRFSGCTVHFVRPDVDAGPIIVQAVLPVLDDDDAEKLAARVLNQEHIIFPLAVRLIAEGRVTVMDERTIIDGTAAPEGAMVNPSER
jgi:phosphoribosylglycinamide formyltransferase-1